MDFRMTILALFALIGLGTSIACLMGKCPPGVPCLALSVCALIECFPAK